jgi:tetratricopeptide (TPR) repeat protein
MAKPSLKKEDNRRKAFPVSKIVIAIAAAVIIIASVLLFYPPFFNSVAYQAARAKNTFSYYVLNEKPRFYYLEMEKNGKDILAGKDVPLEIIYRDEFVVKTIASDDLKGRYTSVIVEGLTNGKNDTGVLLRGVDLVNKIIKSGTAIDKSGIVSNYKIIVNYNEEMIGAVPLKIVITPQDWFRFAKDSANVSEQIEYLKKAILINEKDISVRKVLAGVYLRQGKLDEAVNQYKEVLKIKPDDSAAMLELTKCHIMKKEFDEAIEIAKKNVMSNSKEAKAFEGLGLALEGKGLWAQATQNYQEAVRIEPDNFSLRLKLAQACKNGNMIDRAIEQYKYIAEHSPEGAEALSALGDIYLRLKKYDEAVNYYNLAIKKQPGNAVAYANLASAYAGSGKWQDELDNLKKAVTLSPNEPAIRFNLGAAYERKKMQADAIREYEHVLKTNPEDADALERLADIYLKERKFAQAVKYYEKLKGKPSVKASIYANMGFAYGEIKEYAKSAENYEKAFKSGAKSSTLHYNLAYTYDKLGKERKAIAEYEKVSPPTKEVLSILGQFYLKEKKCPMALKYYGRIAQLEPKKAGSYEGMGNAYNACNNPDAAIKNYQAALKYDSDDSEIYAGLGEAYEKKGLYSEALKAYNSAYALNPESKAARKIPRLKIKLLQEKAQKKN